MNESAREWRDPVEGFEFEPDSVIITSEYQSEKLSACGLDSHIFGEFVDASFYIGAGIHAGIKNGISAQGNVNMLQSLTQHRRVRLGEVLIVRGCIRKITEVPRGVTIDTEVWFEGEDGKRAISASRRSLKPDSAKAGQKGAGERPAPVVDNVTSLKQFNEYELTPEMVKRYSMEGNSIHYEMEAAIRAGFRAPIIGGGMGVHYLLATIWQHCSPHQFELDIYFRRPIFWDHTFSVAANVINNSWSAICLAREGKVLTEAWISLDKPGEVS